MNTRLLGFFGTVLLFIIHTNLEISMNHIYRLFAGLMVVGMLLPGSAFAQDASSLVITRSNTSGPLQSMEMPAAPSDNLPMAPYAIPNKFLKFGSMKNGHAGQTIQGRDETIQRVAGTGSVRVSRSFDGSSDDDNAAVLGFRVVPPDTEGDVGPRHYVQWINSVSEIFDKRGNTILGPFPGNLYFQGLGGICEATNNGDPIVLYDERADRWLVSQFALDFTNANYAMCIAISTSPDPTGGYNQYEINFGTIFPDYPKLGIWGDSYTMTTRNFIDNFDGTFSFGGQFAIALERSAMLNGGLPGLVAFQIPREFFNDGYLPADADGHVSGPAVFGGHAAFGKSRGLPQVFELFELDVDWSNPAAASFTEVAEIAISPYKISAGLYVDQPNGQPLDDLENFTMHRAQVRDFGTHKSLVANHTVKATADGAGIRWYEMRNYGAGWMLHQEGTFSPDSKDRWMGSIAMNGNGDIALGYSLSSKNVYPSIYVTGQTADYSGTGIMNVAETRVHAGGGSQEGASRWGDYSMMSVDPKDDKTFWYTTEYYAETAAFDFNTRIASFRMRSGGGASSAIAQAEGETDTPDEIQSDLPERFAIEQNYPNPFNPTTMISFAMPEAGAVTIKVYNLLGQEMATVVNEVRDAGRHTVSFDASRLSAGVYLYVMESGEFSETRRMTLLK